MKNHRTFAKVEMLKIENAQKNEGFRSDTIYYHFIQYKLTDKINDQPTVFKSTASKNEKWSEISITLAFAKGRQKLKLNAPNSNSNELAIDYIEL